MVYWWFIDCLFLCTEGQQFQLIVSAGSASRHLMGGVFLDKASWRPCFLTTEPEQEVKAVDLFVAANRSCRVTPGPARLVSPPHGCWWWSLFAVFKQSLHFTSFVFSPSPCWSRCALSECNMGQNTCCSFVDRAWCPGTSASPPLRFCTHLHRSHHWTGFTV